MNIKMRCLTIIAVGMLMTASTAAADEKFYMAGAGSFSCGKFIADKEDDEALRVVYFSWAQGFLSGLNMKYFLGKESDTVLAAYTESATDLSDYDALQFWMENYCEENPLDLYVVATIKLWRELRVRQGLERDSRFKPKD